MPVEGQPRGLPQASSYPLSRYEGEGMNGIGMDVASSRRDGSITIACKGELDIASSSSVKDALAAALGHNPERICIDASRVTFISAAGISTLIVAMTSCQGRGIRFDVVLSSQVRRVFDLVGLWWFGVLDDGIAVARDLDVALRNYAKHFADPDERIVSFRRPSGSRSGADAGRDPEGTAELAP